MHLTNTTSSLKAAATWVKKGESTFYMKTYFKIIMQKEYVAFQIIYFEII